MSRSIPFKGWIIRQGYQPVRVAFVAYDHARHRYLLELGAGYRDFEIYRSESEAIAKVRRALEIRKLHHEQSAKRIAQMEEQLAKYAAKYATE